MRSTEHTYGRYLIRTFASDGSVSASAFVGSRSVMRATDKTLDGTLCRIRQLLDERDANQKRARQDGVPTAQEYADSFDRVRSKVKEHHWRMLMALFRAPNRMLTATQLAEAAGYAGYRKREFAFWKAGSDGRRGPGLRHRSTTRRFTDLAFSARYRRSGLACGRRQLALGNETTSCRLPGDGKSRCRGCLSERSGSAFAARTLSSRRRVIPTPAKPA